MTQLCNNEVPTVQTAQKTKEIAHVRCIARTAGGRVMTQTRFPRSTMSSTQVQYVDTDVDVSVVTRDRCTDEEYSSHRG